MDIVAAAAAAAQEPAMDPTLLAVLSIFGGVAVTAGAGLFGAWIQSRREHRKWLRERRIHTYDRAHRLVEDMRYGDHDRDVADHYIKKIEDLANEAGIPPADREKFVDQAREAVGGDIHSPRGVYDWTRDIRARKVEIEASLALVGTPDVRRRLDKVIGTLNEKDTIAYQLELDGLEAAMRKALGIKHEA
jgi:hypothetical protein